MDSGRFNPLAVPALCLWAAAAAFTAAYLCSDAFAAFMEPLARFQERYGALGAFLNRAVFCALLPAAFWIAEPRLRPPRPAMAIAAQIVYCGAMGILNDLLFQWQGEWFGAGRDFATLAKKTAVDQFVWTVFFVSPANSVFYFWAGSAFSASRMRREWPASFVRGQFIPNLVCNWCVWIPVILAVYSFPVTLQIWVSGFACAFWTLLCFRIGRRGRG